MKVIPLKYYDGGFMTQAFAFGGSRSKEKCEDVKYGSSLQNFLIADGNEIILSDTGMPVETPDFPKKQEGTIIFPRSTNPVHIKENFEIFDFELTNEEMNKIRQLEKGKRFFNMTLEEQERNLGGWKPED